MLPYFYISGHHNYAKYITCSLIEDIPKEAEIPLFEGAHVARHGDGRWNGVSCDQFGEQTYICVGKSKGGLVGISLSAEQVSGWVLSYPYMPFTFF